ncbi:MAG: DsbA family protein [Kofleriaceae bacterium]
MIITKRLKGKAIEAWLGPAGDRARRALEQVRERVGKSGKKLAIYLDIAEPWSYLLAQATQRLIEHYPVELEVHVVTPPASDVDPFPLLRSKHAVRDAQQLVEYWDVEFPGKKEADPGAIRDASTVLVRERPARDQLRAFLELAESVWTNDKKTLAKLLGSWGHEAHGSVPPILNESYSRLRKAGHYMAGMASYGGEWYWGIDRLPYLEEVLAKDFNVDLAHVVSPRADRAKLPLENAKSCEVWYSFRSPYSYIALEQIEAVLAPYNIPLELRAVFPMVQRGVQLPNEKRMYVVRDAKREADRLRVPFGNICDPIGPGVDHCIALAYWQRANQLPLVKSIMRGIWSEARDMAEYVDLKYVVERAGLDWNEAKAQLANPEAAKWANTNATDLAVYGLWGVPSIRLGDFVAWGQDRLPLLADRLRRNALPE